MPVDVADRVTTAMRDVVTRGTGTQAAQPFEVFGKTGTTNGSTDAWWVGCARSPQNLCVAVWMGYEYKVCKGVQGSACGEMRGIHGVRQVYGGTLPARIFSRTFEVLREIQAARAAPPPTAAAAEVTDAPTASPTRERRRRRTQTVAPVAPTAERTQEPTPAPAPPSEEPPPPPTQEPTSDPQPGPTLLPGPPGGSPPPPPPASDPPPEGDG